MRYFGKVLAFILFVVAIKFFNDGNMAWWFFMFGFIIVSGFIIGEEEPEEDTQLHTKHRHWYNYLTHQQYNAHCMECGNLNKACICYPEGWEDYKATYVEDVGDDGIIDNIVNIDADIMNNDGLSEWEITKSEEAERTEKRLRDEMNVLTVIDDDDIPF